MCFASNDLQSFSCNDANQVVRLYRASKLDCDTCPLKARCCPGQLARKIPRDVHEDARDMTRRVQNLKTLALRALGPPAALHSASFA